VFEKPHDAEIETSHWSNADELLEACHQLAAEQPDGVFPTEGWLRKRGRHAARPGPMYNTMSIYIKTWLGGVRKVRKLLGQEDASTISWTRQRVLQELQSFYDRYGRTPGAVRGADRTGREAFDAEVVREAGRLEMAIKKYVGSATEACQELGIPCRNYPATRRERVQLSC